MDGRRQHRYEVKVPEGVEPEFLALRFMAIDGITPSFKLVRQHQDETYIQKYKRFYSAYGGYHQPILSNPLMLPWIHLKVPQSQVAEFKKLAAALDCKLKRRDRRRKK